MPTYTPFRFTITAMHSPTPPALSSSHATTLASETVESRVLSVSELNRLARQALESRFPLLRVSGEISNLTRAASGHLYFTLKDAQAQVRCTMWRNRAQLLAFRPENGMQVEARALVTLYEVRGDFQLGIEGLARAGTGSLFEAFLRLKDKLGAEGLFDAAGKRPLPRFPRRVGVITSPAAAAFQDVLAALRRRAPHLEVVLYPAPVQGDTAAALLTRMVQEAGRRVGHDGVEALLVVRGGGSLEDLWAFNDEALARAIRACPVPVVSGVGHETDFTIADFVADLRAPTPTAAAELVSAGYHEAALHLAQWQRALATEIDNRLHGLAQRVDRAALRLIHPRERLRRSADTVAALQRRLTQALARQQERRRARLALAAQRLAARRPDITRADKHREQLALQLEQGIRRLLRDRHQRLGTLASHLAHLAPQAVLQRGYSITRDAAGNIVRASGDVAEDAGITVQLAHGSLTARVTGTHD